MPGRKLISRRAAIQRNDLLRLGEAQLADLLAEQLSSLPYHQQKQWARRHLPDRPKGKSASEPRPAALLDEIEAFCALQARRWTGEPECGGAAGPALEAALTGCDDIITAQVTYTSLT